MNGSCCDGGTQTYISVLESLLYVQEISDSIDITRTILFMLAARIMRSSVIRRRLIESVEDLGPKRTI